MIAGHFHPKAAVGRMGMQGTCAVRLIDRRTGTAHRINGTPLVIFTREPGVAVAELLDGRDLSVWEARIETLCAGAGR